MKELTSPCVCKLFLVYNFDTLIDSTCWTNFMEEVPLEKLILSAICLVDFTNHAASLFILTFTTYLHSRLCNHSNALSIPDEVSLNYPKRARQALFLSVCSQLLSNAAEVSY